MKTFPLALICALLCAPGAATAQTATAGSGQTSDSWNGLPVKYQVDAGLFRVSPQTVLRLQSPNGGDNEVSFEDDLGLEPTANTAWIDATWRIGKRHRIKLASMTLTRETTGEQLNRSFVWNGQTYAAGLQANSRMSTTTTSGYYRFAIFSTPRFEAGPAVGLGYLRLSAGIKATGSLSTPTGIQSRTLDESTTSGYITGDIGAYFQGWIARRAVLRGDYLYILVKPGDSRASVTDWRLTLDTYPWRHVGIGAQYKFNRFSYDRAVGKAGLGGHLSFKGPQVYLSFLF